MDPTPTAGPHDSLAASPWQKIAEARVGQLVGDRLRLERVLGIGGTATVYAARHRNGRALAVKVLHPEFAHNEGIRRRFLAEGYAANKVEHPDAVAILDEGEDAAGNVFLVMELLHGQTLLEQLIEQGRLPVAQVVSAALRVLDVLAQGHERGVVHRDVKPSNIFRTDDGTIKLLDFGIARVAGDRARFMTRPGTTLGTPGFMAPELAAGRLDELDALTDLWAVGATMFQLLTDQPVHPSQNDNQQLLLAATQPVRSLGTLRPELDATIVKVVDRALAFEQRDRWPSARAMHTALSDAARAAGLFGRPTQAAGSVHDVETAPEMAMPASQPTPRSPQYRARIRWLLFALFALALGATMLTLRNSGRQDWQVESGAASVPLPAPSELASRATQRAQQVGTSPLASVAEPASAPTPRMPPEVNRAAPQRSTAGSKKTSGVPRTAAPAAPKSSASEPSNPLFFPGK